MCYTVAKFKFVVRPYVLNLVILLNKFSTTAVHLHALYSYGRTAVRYPAPTGHSPADAQAACGKFNQSKFKFKSDSGVPRTTGKFIDSTRTYAD
eukprot:SAG31_NODE_11325_length_1042_cov_0.963945_2_plen_94_part_00